MTLTADLEALRNVPGTDLKTLREVDAVLSRYQGKRLTIKKGADRAARINQARAIAQLAPSRPDAVRAIAGGLGVSVRCARRYQAEIERETG